jgi:hypothetical protein
MNRSTFLKTLLLAPFAAKAALLRANLDPRNTPAFRQAYAKCADGMREIRSRVQPPIHVQDIEVCPMGGPSGQIYYMDLVSTPVVPGRVKLD